MARQCLCALTSSAPHSSLCTTHSCSCRLTHRQAPQPGSCSARTKQQQRSSHQDAGGSAGRVAGAVAAASSSWTAQMPGRLCAGVRVLQHSSAADAGAFRAVAASCAAGERALVQQQKAASHTRVRTGWRHGRPWRWARGAGECRVLPCARCRAPLPRSRRQSCSSAAGACSQIAAGSTGVQHATLLLLLLRRTLPRPPG